MGMKVAHLLNVPMSGRFSVSALCSYCPHCGLAWTKSGGYRSAKNSPQRKAPAEENKESGGFLVSWIVSWFNLLKPIWLHIWNGISNMLPFYAEVRMSTSLEGPEINTPVCTCGWLMWKLILLFKNRQMTHCSNLLHWTGMREPNLTDSYWCMFQL